MAAADSSLVAQLAHLAGAMERASGDLAIAEEPARLVAALEAAAPVVAMAPGTTDGPAPAGSLAALAAAIRAGTRSPVDLTDDCLRRIERLDGRLHAFITVDGERARALARTREAEARAGQLRGPLHGIPLAHKDLCAIQGFPTSCGTATDEYFVADADATAVARLEAAGAITLGKLNMSELALGPFGDNAHRGDAETPWRPGHVSGGSSSGSGAAVAAGLALAALGTDTGGSIRLPAACCGIVGLKPTYGRVSRAGVMPLSWSMDHVGPMARRVHDVALLLEVIAGRDPRDATTSGRPVGELCAGLAAPVAGLRVGVPDAYFWDGVDPEVVRAVRGAIGVLADLGVHVTEATLPDPQVVADVVNVLARCESAAIHARVLREQPHALQPAVRARLEVGLHISAVDYVQASRLRARLARAFLRQVFGAVDALAMPTIPEPAPAIASVKAGSIDEIVRRMGRFSRLTRPWNGLGLPALSVPCGFSAAGLPIGLQLVGRPFDEATLLRLGHAYEEAAGVWSRQPPLASD
jgi:aspartyl-tRNA(Asn)/glutamyl-tRNA(Gln) amidotransferase subunit A